MEDRWETRRVGISERRAQRLLSFNSKVNTQFNSAVLLTTPFTVYLIVTLKQNICAIHNFWWWKRKNNSSNVLQTEMKRTAWWKGSSPRIHHSNSQIKFLKLFPKPLETGKKTKPQKTWKWELSVWLFMIRDHWQIFIFILLVPLKLNFTMGRKVSLKWLCGLLGPNLPFREWNGQISSLIYSGDSFIMALHCIH